MGNQNTIQNTIIGNLLLYSKENQKTLSDKLLPDFFDGLNKEIVTEIKKINKENNYADIAILKLKFDDAHLLTCISKTTTYQAEREQLQELKREYLEKNRLNLHNLKDLDKVKERILEIEKKAQILDSTNLKTIQEVLADSIVKTENNLINLQNLPKTGFEFFDKIFGGFIGGQICTVGGYSGVGKSTFLFSLIRNLGIQNQILIVNLEMKNEIMTARILSALSGVPLIYTANLGNPEVQLDLDKYDLRKKLNFGLKELDKIKLKMLDNAYNLSTIIGAIKEEVTKTNLKFVFLDYLQLIQTSSKKDRYLEIGEITRELKILAQELNITIILLAQLGRSSLNREEPQLNDLRESGSIEMDSDLVFLLHRNKQKETEIILAKDRMFGKFGKAILKYNYIQQCYE